MIYRMHVPAPPLDHYIEHFWYYAGYTPATHADKLLPDGAMELIIDLTDVPKRLYHSYGGGFRTFRNCWISGLQKGFLVIGNMPNSSMIGARFLRGGAVLCFGLPMAERAGQVGDLERGCRGEARASGGRGRAAPTPELKFGVFGAFLARRRGATRAHGRAFEFALHEMRGNEPNLMRTLATSVGLSHNGLIGRLHRRVGVGPKFLARVLRFQRIIQGVGRREDVDWT